MPQREWGYITGKKKELVCFKFYIKCEQSRVTAVFARHWREPAFLVQRSDSLRRDDQVADSNTRPNTVRT